MNSFFRPLFLFAALSPLPLSAAPGDLSPRAVVERFDSLVRAGADSEASALCTGQALRLFPFLAAAEAKLTPFLDTTLSRDTVLEEKRRGEWTALKIRSRAVFTRPVMGLSSLKSVQAVHLYRDLTGWKIADFEELAGARSALKPHTGIPSAADTVSSMLPVSRLSPDTRGATCLRMEISLRSGDSLPRLPEGPGQKVLDRGWSRALIETRKPALPASSSSARRARVAAVYLASTRDLDLRDPLLRAKAAALRKGSPNTVEIARRIYAFVSGSFDYQLGASLFGTSREALRSLRGDCSEAAVLTAALLRAAGIPSRVVVGFATLKHGVFIGHAWAEAYVNGTWIGVDPALREFPAGAERVALARLSGAKDMQTEASNVLMRTLADLDVQITAAWNDTVPLPLRAHPGSGKDVEKFFRDVLKGVGQ